MGHSIHVTHPSQVINARLVMPGSKSESNRALILDKLSGQKTKLVNLSEAADTLLLARLLNRGGRNLDVKDCGTCLRFLVPFYCVLNKNKVIAGNERLCQRPIGKLVQALHDLGFKLNYARNDGYPPVEVIPIEGSLKNKVTIDGGESSQYVSGLAMTAPLLPGGLAITITGRMVSRPYLDLTLDMMQRFGASCSWQKNTLVIPQQRYNPPAEVVLAGDWSAASYWYAVAALAKEAKIEIRGLNLESAQGDKVLKEWMIPFGIETTAHDGYIQLEKTGSPAAREMSFDFTNHPDLAMTVIVLAAALNIRLNVTGIETLRIKESDRVEALASELKKINAWLEPVGDGYELKSNFRPARDKIESYDDHRMVMAFAPLGLAGGVTIEKPRSVSKSYPQFWSDLQLAGFNC